jgi:DNA ligase (NAD+)
MKKIKTPMDLYRFKPAKNSIRTADLHSSGFETDNDSNPSTDLNLYRFKTSDTKDVTWIYEKSKPHSHKWYFLKDESFRVWTEREYKGDATFGGKNYFELLAELNVPVGKLKNTTATEMGMKLHLGTAKLIKKIKGETVNIELKYPEILVDDEHTWKNRKPEIIDAPVDEPELDPSYECECDYCLSVKMKNKMRRKKNKIKVLNMKIEVLNELHDLYPMYEEHKMRKLELAKMENEDVQLPLSHKVNSNQIKKVKETTPIKNKTMKKTTTKTLIKQYVDNGVPILETFTDVQLSEMLLNANSAYHSTKKPIMSDSQYDVLRNYIEEKYPSAEVLQQIGAPVKCTKNKVTLPFNMPSMDKIKPESTTLTNWCVKYPGPYVISCKLDGVSGMYAMEEKGPRLYTRGDGSVGQDISHLITPLNLPSIPVGTVVRGEFIVPKTTFDAKYKDTFSNPRNFVAGLINTKTVNSSIKDLDFVVYEMIRPDMKPSEQMAELVKHKFDVVQHDLILLGLSKDLLMQTLMAWRANNKYEIDGIIVSNDRVYARTAKNPEHAFAFKMAINDQMAETEVVDVIWEASQDGYLKPRVKIAPISIGGVNIEYTTGFNGKFIEDNKIGPGAKIQMIRSGDVIPYIKSVLVPAAEGKMPDADAMPYEWNATHVDIVLKNVDENDTVKEKNIVGFFSDLEVEGLATGNVRRIMAAGFDTVPKILKMTEADFKDVDGFKKKMIEKVRTSMKEKVGSASIVQLMAASNKFGRGVGIRVLTPLMDANPDFLTKDETKAEKIAKLNAAGIHKNAELFYNNIEGFNTFMRECGLNEVKTTKVDSKADVKEQYDKSNPLFEKSIVMTKIRNKEIIEHLKKVGATLEDSFRKNTVALVMKDKSDITNKMRDAEKRGIEIFTVEEFKAKYMV